MAQERGADDPAHEPRGEAETLRHRDEVARRDHPAVAALEPGQTVLDLGSGGGLDVLLSAKRVGPTGKVFGLDMTDEMLTLARENQQKAPLVVQPTPP